MKMKTLLIAAGCAAFAVMAVFAVSAVGSSSGELYTLLASPETNLAMATLAANVLRDYQLGEKNELPVIGSDIIYQGAAVGVVDATGLARPLAAGDRFAGFAEAKADNAAGAASAINVNLYKRGRVSLTVDDVVITDVGQPVYATDDATFQMSPVGGSFIGFVDRWVSSGIAIVAFDALNFRDPYDEYTVREAITGNDTLASVDSGKLFWVTADAVITLPAVAVPFLGKVVNGGAFGTVSVALSPNSSDSLEAPGLTAADDKDVINTKATARRGDFAVIGSVDTVGHTITELKGTWALETP